MKTEGLLSQRPVLTNAIGIVAIGLFVGFHAWARGFTALEFVIELVALLVIFLIIQFRPTWWSRLHPLSRSVFAFLFFATIGLAFAWVSPSDINLGAWSIFFGFCGVAVAFFPQSSILIFYLIALFAFVALYELGLFRAIL